MCRFVQTYWSMYVVGCWFACGPSCASCLLQKSWALASCRAVGEVHWRTGDVQGGWGREDGPVDLTPSSWVGGGPCRCNPASISMPGASAMPFYHSPPSPRTVDKVEARWLTPNRTGYKVGAQWLTPTVGRKNCRRLRSPNPKGLRPSLLH